MESPKTLQQAIIFFSNEDNCISYVKDMRWPDGVVVCPTCGRKDVSWLAKQKKWQCKSKHTKRQFSAKVGTIYEDSPISLDKWLMATWLVVNCKNGVSSYEIARDLDITQKSAWFMMHRIRLAMKDTTDTKLGGSNKGGPVEIDEAFVGGDPKNWHYDHRKKMMKESRSERVQRYQNAYTHKTAVMGMFDRESRQVRAKVVPNVRRETLQAEILKNIHYGSKVFTDEAVAYKSLNWEYIHKTVNHAETYVNGQVHTNSLENFWSLMKRNLRGTYVAVEPFHLDRYIDEQVFRFNNRVNKTDEQRFKKVLSQIVGKRLTYAEVTGKVGETTPF
jgi:hypothetical protein